MMSFPIWSYLALDSAPAPTPMSKRRPLSRHYRNPKDPAQVRRIGKAHGKRNRKGWKLVDDMYKSARNNKAHAHHVPGTMRRAALNPFYIAK